MKSDNIYAWADLIRSTTPYGFLIGSIIVVLTTINNSEKLIGDRFLIALGVATGLSAAAAGGYSPQTRQQQPQTKIDQAEQVEIDNK